MVIDKKSDKEAHVYYLKASEHQVNKNFDNALIEIEKAIELASSDKLLAVCLTLKCGYLRRKECFREAVASGERAVSLFSNNYVAWSELGLSYLQLENYTNAERSLEQATSLKLDYSLFTLLAKTQIYTNSAKAIESANKALQLKPGWDEAIQIRDAAFTAYNDEKNLSD